MTQPSKRPAHLKPPAHLAPNPPVPAPKAAEQTDDPAGLSPTRYGDWEKKGITVDF